MLSADKAKPAILLAQMWPLTPTQLVRLENDSRGQYGAGCGMSSSSGEAEKADIRNHVVGAGFASWKMKSLLDEGIRRFKLLRVLTGLRRIFLFGERKHQIKSLLAVARSVARHTTVQGRRAQ